MLLAELGEHPPYAWIYSESPEFKRAMRVVDDAGRPDWDYECPCGLNVSVHSAVCAAEKLVVAVPKFAIRKTDEQMVDQWVLCAWQQPPSEDEWHRMFGTRLPYNRNGSWAPVATETRVVAMPPGKLPGEAWTMAIIRARQKTREIPERDIANATENRWAKKDKDRQEMIRHRISDALPVNPEPGKRGGSVSFGGTDDLSPALRRKIQQGENLVTI